MLGDDVAADADDTCVEQAKLENMQTWRRCVGWPASQCWGADHVAVSRDTMQQDETEQLRLEVPVLGSWPSY